MRGRPTSPETRAAAVADYVTEGMSSSAVAEKHGVNPKSVTEWVRAAGEVVRAPGAPAVISGQDVALTGGEWVRVGLVMRWQPFIGAPERELSDRARRVQWEDATVSDIQARAAHARFFAGDRDDETLLGERVYQRRMKRQKRAEVEAA